MGNNIVILRLEPDGSLDDSSVSMGLRDHFTGFEDYVLSVAACSDGKICCIRRDIRRITV